MPSRTNSGKRNSPLRERSNDRNFYVSPLETNRSTKFMVETLSTLDRAWLREPCVIESAALG